MICTEFAKYLQILVGPTGYMNERLKRLLIMNPKKYKI